MQVDVSCSLCGKERIGTVELSVRCSLFGRPALEFDQEAALRFEELHRKYCEVQLQIIADTAQEDTSEG